MNAFNGEEIAGRKILVREDREDRDVKQYNKENGIERPNTRRPKRGGRGGGGGANGGGGFRPDQNGHSNGNGHAEAQQSSGLQARSSTALAWLQHRDACTILASLLLCPAAGIMGQLRAH